MQEKCLKQQNKNFTVWSEPRQLDIIIEELGSLSDNETREENEEKDRWEESTAVIRQNSNRN